MNINRRAFCKNTIIIPGAVALFLDQSSQSMSGQTVNTSTQVKYMLRYFMRNDTALEQARDLIDYCRLNHMRDVILFSSNNWDMGWNMPTLEEVRNRVEILRPVFKLLRDAGELEGGEHGRTRQNGLGEYQSEGGGADKGGDADSDLSGDDASQGGGGVEEAPSCQEERREDHRSELNAREQELFERSEEGEEAS